MKLRRCWWLQLDRIVELVVEHEGLYFYTVYYVGTILCMWVINSYPMYTSICVEMVECHL